MSKQKLSINTVPMRTTNYKKIGFEFYVPFYVGNIRLDVEI